jgi:hypothetical protein
MYYPLSQITSNLNTNGGEFAYADTEQEYKGYYWTTSSGKYYTGKTPQDTPTQELIKLSFKGDIGEALLDAPPPELTINNFVTKVDTIQCCIDIDATFIFDISHTCTQSTTLRCNNCCQCNERNHSFKLCNYVDTGTR